MTATAATSASLPSGRRTPAAELVLAGLAVLTFALVPIHVNTIYSGLPAHPLFLHVPVILIPLVTIAALVLALRPAFFARHGVWIGGLTVLALAATNLTMGAGEELRRDLHLDAAGGFGDSALVHQHAEAADKLRLLFIFFTAVLLVALAVFRARDGRGLGISFLDRLLGWIRSSAPLTILLRVLLAVLAAGSLYFVFRTGDLGSKAVWQDRIHRGGGFRFPGGAPGPGNTGFPGGRNLPAPRQLPPSSG